MKMTKYSQNKFTYYLSSVLCISLAVSTMLFAKTRLQPCMSPHSVLIQNKIHQTLSGPLPVLITAN